MNERPFIRTKLNADQMAHLAFGAAYDIAANCDDPAEVEAIIRWVTLLRPIKDRHSLLSQTLHTLAGILAPLLQTAEEASPEALHRLELGNHASEHYANAGGR